MMSDAAVKAKTGKDWPTWFGLLDRAGAAKLEHKAIAALLATKHGVPGWWRQSITVEYERARGLRDRFKLSSQTKDKYFRGAWKEHARLEIGFYARGPGKAQIALQVRKLAKKGDVEIERAAWKAALSKLQAMLEEQSGSTPSRRTRTLPQR